MTDRIKHVEWCGTWGHVPPEISERLRWSLVPFLVPFGVKQQELGEQLPNLVIVF